MLIGGIIYLFPINIKNKKYISIINPGLIGLALIISSYFFFSKDTAWPGYGAILPILGTYLFIQDANQNSFIANNVIIQKLGMWSYSIYLWHWPIAVSYSYYQINEEYKLLGVLLSILLGHMSYSLIEKRQFKSKKPYKTLLLYACTSLCFLTFGLILFITQGLAQRESLVSNPLIQGGTSENYKVNEGVTLLNTNNEYDYLLLGDSNSNHYVRGILHSGTKVKNSWYATCISLPNSINTRAGYYPSWKQDCINNHKLGINENSNIIIAQSWERQIDNALECTNKKCNLTGNYYQDLESELNELITLYGDHKKIYIVGELPKPKHVESTVCLRTNNLIGIERKCDSKSSPKDESIAINKVLHKISLRHKNLIYIDMHKSICKNNICNYELNGKPIFMSDGGHLSGVGSEFMWNYILNQIDANETSSQN